MNIASLGYRLQYSVTVSLFVMALICNLFKCNEAYVEAERVRLDELG